MLYKFSCAVLLVAACLSARSVIAEEAQSPVDSLRGFTRSIISSGVSTGRDILGGISEGVMQGRQSVDSADGARVIGSDDAMGPWLEVELLEVATKDQVTTIVFGLKNTSEKPVRLVNLTSSGVLAAVDQDGYAVMLKQHSNPETVTIPARLAAKHSFVFEPTNSKIVVVRLFGKDYSPVTVEG